MVGALRPGGGGRGALVLWPGRGSLARQAEDVVGALRVLGWACMAAPSAGVGVGDPDPASEVAAVLAGPELVVMVGEQCVGAPVGDGCVEGLVREVAPVLQVLPSAGVLPAPLGVDRCLTI